MSDTRSRSLSDLIGQTVHLVLSGGSNDNFPCRLIGIENDWIAVDDGAGTPVAFYNRDAIESIGEMNDDLAGTLGRK